jgi:hypothetical protein
MHDGNFLPGLPGVKRALIAGIGPDGRAEVAMPGEVLVFARSLVSLGPASIGREAAVVRLEGGEALILGLIRPLVPDVEADGEKLVLEARREVILRCGKASIKLTADGRVTIRGTQILSRSDGSNRVQGASVQLN